LRLRLVFRRERWVANYFYRPEFDSFDYEVYAPVPRLLYDGRDLPSGRSPRSIETAMTACLRCPAILNKLEVAAWRGVAIGMIAVLASVACGAGASAEGRIERLWQDLRGHKAHKPAAKPASSPAAQSPPAAPEAASPPAAQSPAVAPATASPSNTSPGANQPAATTPQPPQPAHAAEQAKTPPASSAPAVPVVLPKVQTVSDTMEVTGNAAAVNQVKLIARVPGYLEQIHFQDGALVKKDDLLFTIQQDQYKAQRQQADAQLQAQEVLREHAHIEVIRYSALLKQHATSQVDVDHWTYEEKTAEANILAAQAQIALADLNLSYTEVRAPFDGQMSKHFVDPGNLVGGNGQEAALAEITQLDPIYVVANISSQQALDIRANLDQRRLTLKELYQIPVEAALSDETGFPHRGTIQYVAPTLDAATGTLYVRGILPNPNKALLPGVFVKIRLPMGKVTQSALLAPVRALQEDQGGNYLMVVGQDDVIQKRYVKLGLQVGDLQVVTSGLERNDPVVVGELWRVTSGAKITPQLTAISH
jgi:RND family efflux transporter MFP subunit